MKFDYNVDHIEPGLVLEQSQCERIMGFEQSKDPVMYQFYLMQLNEFIEKSLWKIGKHYTCVTKQGGINVLTHEAASRYNSSRFVLAIRKQMKCNRRLLAVDLSRLTQQAREEHNRAVIKQSYILTMTKKIDRDLRPEPHVDLDRNRRVVD